MTEEPLDPKYCNAIKRDGTGERCRKPAGWGIPGVKVGCCKAHGGATTAHRKHAELVVARQACETLGLEIDTTPTAALLQEVRETAANVAFYRGQVMDLDTHPEDDEYIPDGDSGHWERGAPGVYGRTYHQSGVPTGEAKPHVLVQLYNDERKHLVAVTSAALKANVEERAVTLAEQDAQRIVTMMRGVLQDLNMLDDPRALESIRRHLMLMAGDSAVQAAA